MTRGQGFSGRTYSYPSEIEIQKLKDEAAKRRAALKSAGCSTYTTGIRGEHQAIVCLCCGLGSHNPTDVAEKYCGFCHEWHTDWSDRSELKQLQSYCRTVRNGPDRAVRVEGEVAGFWQTTEWIEGLLEQCGSDRK